jgi:ribonuclease Y
MGIMLIAASIILVAGILIAFVYKKKSIDTKIQELKTVEKEMEAAKKESHNIVETAKKEALNIKKEMEIKVKEELYDLKEEAEKEIKQSKYELHKKEQRIVKHKERNGNKSKGRTL